MIAVMAGFSGHYFCATQGVKASPAARPFRPRSSFGRARRFRGTPESHYPWLDRLRSNPGDADGSNFPRCLRCPLWRSSARRFTRRKAAASSNTICGVSPSLASEKLAAQTRAVCFSEIAILYSGLARTPLWSAERLTPARIERARGLGAAALQRLP